MRVANVRARGYKTRVIFERLSLWCDPLKRPGPEAMAVDEWLLETSERPVLRVYGWLGDWGSIGYFGNLADAGTSFPGLEWVRRWTGGGTVNHREDWTYTVIAPAAESLAGLRGAESYRLIHAALASCLVAEDIEAALSAGTHETGATSCFANPVSHDLVGPSGRKIAGAGQRRTIRGLLHQGSVAAPCSAEDSRMRAERLASLLAAEWDSLEFQPPDDVIEQKIRKRYSSPTWTLRR